MVITTLALVGPRIGPDMCVCAPRRRRCNEARTKSTNNGRHDTHSRWQDFEKHNRLATRESQILGA